MNRPVGATKPEVIGPDETGLPCPDCGQSTMVRRHYTYEQDGAFIFGRSDFCRGCLYMEAAA